MRKQVWLVSDLKTKTTLLVIKDESGAMPLWLVVVYFCLVFFCLLQAFQVSSSVFTLMQTEMHKTVLHRIRAFESFHSFNRHQKSNLDISIVLCNKLDSVEAQLN